MRTSISLFLLPIFILAQAPETLPRTPSGEPIYKLSPGNGVRAPIALSTPEPEYCDKPRKKKIQGSVVVEGYVGKDGHFHEVKIAVPLEKCLDRNALSATQQWTFLPAIKDGQPVNCAMRVQISYTLHNTH